MSEAVTHERKGTGFLDRLFGIDLRSLALLRIALGTYVLWDLVDRARGLTDHYSDWGVYPRDAVLDQWSNGTYWERLWAYASLHMLSGDPVWQGFLFLLAAVFAIALLVGYRSRGAAFFSWLLIVSIQNRNPQILHGADQMIRQLMFWSMFLPLGARFSVDGLCAVQRAYRVPIATRVLSVGSIGLLLQTCFLYWFTVALKSAPQWHQEGTALYYALSLEHYQTPLGRWVVHTFPLWVLKAMTWATMLVEALGPCVALSPFATQRLRLWLIPTFFVFHLVLIGTLMDVGPIVSTSAMLWIGFIPPLFWEKATELWQRIPANSAKTQLERVRERLIRWRNRRIVARLEAREGIPNLKPTLIAQVFAAVTIAYVLLWNLRGVDGRRFAFFSPQYDWIANLVRLDQNWGMFAPYPMIEDGWFIMPAELADGSTVDLLRGGAPLTWEKPKDVTSMYYNERQRKHLMNLWPMGYSWQRPYYFRYRKHQWEQQHREPTKQIHSMSLYYMLHITPPPGGQQPVPRKMLLLGTAPKGAVER